MDRRFWGSALLAALLCALVVAIAVPLVLRLEPRGGLRLLTPLELWLLSTFTLGILGILFGSSVALTGRGGRGAREGLSELIDRAEALDRARVEARELAGAEPGRRAPGPAPEEGTPGRHRARLSAAPSGDPSSMEPEESPGAVDAGWWVAASGAFLLLFYALVWLLAGRAA